MTCVAGLPLVRRASFYWLALALSLVLALRSSLFWTSSITPKQQPSAGTIALSIQNWAYEPEKDAALVASYHECDANSYAYMETVEGIPLNEELRIMSPCQRGQLLRIVRGLVTKAQIELVLAKHREDISWSDVYTNVRTVYCKGNATYRLPGCVPLPNVGRESHTYLFHIVTRYEDLAEWTTFSPADEPTTGYGGHPGFGHMFPGVSFHDYALGTFSGKLFNGSNGSRFVFTGALKPRGKTLWHILAPGYDHRRQPLKKRAQAQCQIRGAVPESYLTKMGGFQRFLARLCGTRPSQIPGMLFSYTDWLGLPRPKVGTFFFSQGARFAVSKARIRERPRAFYEQLLGLVNESEVDCVGFFNEWLWYYIMGRPEGSPCA